MSGGEAKLAQLKAHNTPVRKVTYFQANYEGIHEFDTEPGKSTLTALYTAAGCDVIPLGTPIHTINDPRQLCLYRKVLRAIIVGPGKRLRRAGHGSGMQELRSAYSGLKSNFDLVLSMTSGPVFDAVVHLRTLDLIENLSTEDGGPAADAPQLVCVWACGRGRGCRCVRIYA